MPVPLRVSVLFDGALLTLNRAVGVLRRRNVPVQHLAVHLDGPGRACQLSVEFHADAAGARSVVEQFRKIIGVREVTLDAAPQAKEKT